MQKCLTSKAILGGYLSVFEVDLEDLNKLKDLMMLDELHKHLINMRDPGIDLLIHFAPIYLLLVLLWIEIPLILQMYDGPLDYSKVFQYLWITVFSKSDHDLFVPQDGNYLVLLFEDLWLGDLSLDFLFQVG